MGSLTARLFIFQKTAFSLLPTDRNMMLGHVEITDAAVKSMIKHNVRIPRVNLTVVKLRQPKRFMLHVKDIAFRF